MQTVSMPAMSSETAQALKKVALTKWWIVLFLGVVTLNWAIQSHHPIPKTLFTVIMVLLLLLAGTFAPFAFVQKLARDGVDVKSLTPNPAKLLSWPDLYPIFKTLFFAPLCFALLLDLNSWFDYSPVEPHVEVVIGKYVTYGKGGNNAYFKVSSWRPHVESDEIYVADRSVYDSFQVGDRITINKHRGALRIPWIEAVFRKQ